jgi:hypothetical protein
MKDILEALLKSNIKEGGKHGGREERNRVLFSR